MNRFYFKNRVGALTDKVIDYTKSALSSTLSLGSLEHMSSEELKMMQDGMCLIKECQGVMNDMLAHYDELEDEIIQAKEDRKEIMRLLEELNKKK